MKASSIEVIDSLASFIQRIESMPKPDEGYVRYYRGQSVNQPLIPSVLRSPALSTKESEMYNDIINARPQEFENCTCTFDKLVKMQHYGIPTRLLDISTNPLVALYMAISDNPCKCRASLECICNLKNDKGCGCYASKECICKTKFKPTIYVVDIHKDYVKNYDSDSVAIISALARCNEKKKDNLYKEINRLYYIINNAFLSIKKEIDYLKIISSLVKELSMKEREWRNMINKPYQTTEKIKDAYKLEESIEELKKDIDYRISHLIHQMEFSIVWEKVDNPEDKFKNSINDAIQCEELFDNIYLELYKIVRKHFGKIKNKNLLHEVRNDKPHFEDRMNFETFESILCVKPKMNNARIIKQSGAFLLFPYVEKTSYYDEVEYMLYDSIYINSEKENINKLLESLSNLGYNAESLYTDMDTITKAIKEKYINNEKTIRR